MLGNIFNYLFLHTASTERAPGAPPMPPLAETSEEEHLRFLIGNSNLTEIQLFTEAHPGLNLTERDQENKSFLDYVFRSAHPRADKEQLVEYLVTKAPNLVNLRGHLGNPPLHAILKGDAEPELRVSLTQILLRAGAQPNSEDTDHKTPLFCLAFKNLPFAETQALLDLLIEAGANPNQAHSKNILNYPLAHAVLFQKANFIHAYLTPLLQPYPNSKGSFYAHAAHYTRRRSRSMLPRSEDLKFRALAKRVSLIREDPLFHPEFFKTTLETALSLGDGTFRHIERSVSLFYPERIPH